MSEFYTRRNTNRIPQHDYSKPGQYFITICVQSRAEIFGAIENEQIKLNAGIVSGEETILKGAETAPLQ